MEKRAMLSCPRLEEYKYFPFGWMAISAASLWPENPAGSAEMRCTERKVSLASLAKSLAKTVTVESSSPSTYMKLPSPEKAAWRGPVPGASVAEKKSLALGEPEPDVAAAASPLVSVPFLASK